MLFSQGGGSDAGRVWTGTNTDGTKNGSWRLGTGDAAITGLARDGTTGGNWINSGAAARRSADNNLFYYALSEEVTVAGVIAANPYDTWTGQFPDLTDPDPARDFDGGGLSTALEWVLGGDPTDPSDDATIVPTIDNDSGDPDGKLHFIFRRSAEARDDANTAISVEYGSDLDGWEAAVHQGTGPEDITVTEEMDGFGFDIDRVTVALPTSLAGDGKIFVRLKVEINT